MTDIASSRSFIQVEEAQYKSSVSEAIMQKIGANINLIHDKNDEQDGRLTDVEGDIAAILSNITISTFNVDSPSITVPANTFYFINFAGQTRFNFPHISPDLDITDGGFISIIAGPSTVISSIGGGSTIFGYVVQLKA